MVLYEFGSGQGDTEPVWFGLGTRYVCGRFVCSVAVQGRPICVAEAAHWGGVSVFFSSVILSLPFPTVHATEMILRSLSTPSAPPYTRIWQVPFGFFP
jgi:hypothetical protein